MQVALSMYSAASGMPSSARKLRDAEIAPQLLELREENDFVYGVRKFWKVAKRARIDIGRDQTARCMNLLGVEDMRRE